MLKDINIDNKIKAEILKKLNIKTKKYLYFNMEQKEKNNNKAENILLELNNL